MTDERIKEEFEKWIKGVTTQEEADFANRFHHYYMDLAQGYISGFRAAERLAKIEVLEEVILRLEDAEQDAYIIAEIKDKLNKLKGEQ